MYKFDLFSKKGLDSYQYRIIIRLDLELYY